MHIKKFLFLLGFISIFQTISAQDTIRPNGISTKFLFIDHQTFYDESLAEPDTYTNGIEVGYQRYINKYFTLGIPVKVGVIRANEDSFEDKRTFLDLDVVGQVRLFDNKRFLVPYLFTGVGAVYEVGKDAYAQIPMGMGLNFRLGPWGYATIQSEYRHTLGTMKRSNLQHGIGFTFILGSKLKVDKPIIPEVSELDKGANDTDGDGVLDSIDICPNVAGVIAFKGCPDTDMDGIADNEDECPTEAGKKSANGCPDDDGDGVPNSTDGCPDVAGDINGCPDSDGDGYVDSEDKCPTLAGKLEGCPDSDGDGVADNLDKCPEKAGLLKMNGCPDSDNDGLADNQDSCPNQAGDINNGGCPGLKMEEKAVLKHAMSAVQFETGSDQLLSSSSNVLDQIVSLMIKYNYYNLVISGHTDNVGSETNNQKLSEKRAKACLTYIASRGIDKYRMSYNGYGEERPIADNNTADGRRLNRRTEFEFLVK